MSRPHVCKSRCEGSRSRRAASAGFGNFGRMCTMAGWCEEEHGKQETRKRRNASSTRSSGRLRVAGDTGREGARRPKSCHKLAHNRKLPLALERVAC